jgi:hypothetical protein
MAGPIRAWGPHTMGGVLATALVLALTGCYDGAAVDPCSASCSAAEPCAEGLVCSAGLCAEPGQSCAPSTPVLHLDLVGPGKVQRGTLEVLCDSTAGSAACDVPWEGSDSETLVAIGADFAGWSGDCAGLGDCILPRGASHRVGASFGAGRRTVSVTVVGGEAGEVVTSEPPGITCAGGMCEASFLPADTITLTASAGKLGRWRTDDSWTGPCASQDATSCVLRPDSGASVVGYTFVRTPTVTLQTMGTDDYRITGNLGTCTASMPCGPVALDAGTNIALTAEVTDSGQVSGWSCLGCLVSGVRNEKVTTVLGTDDLTISATVTPGFAVVAIASSRTTITTPPALATPPMGSARASFSGPLSVEGVMTACTAGDLGAAGCTIGGCMGDDFTCQIDVTTPRVLNFP